jgi:midasin (ATPase involved in ribosome maturation)
MQTDIMDLLGSDLPVESDEGIKFAWSDGILLQVKMYYLKGVIVCSLL